MLTTQFLLGERTRNFTVTERDDESLKPWEFDFVSDPDLVVLHLISLPLNCCKIIKKNSEKFIWPKDDKDSITSSVLKITLEVNK